MERDPASVATSSSVADSGNEAGGAAVTPDAAATVPLTPVGSVFAADTDYVVQLETTLVIPPANSDGEGSKDRHDEAPEELRRAA